MKTDLINVDTIVDEVVISESQLFDLHKKYGADGIKFLEKQVLDKGFVIERCDFDMTIKIRRRKDRA